MIFDTQCAVRFNYDRGARKALKPFQCFGGFVESEAYGISIRRNSSTPASLPYLWNELAVFSDLHYARVNRAQGTDSIDGSETMIE